MRFVLNSLQSDKAIFSICKKVDVVFKKRKKRLLKKKDQTYITTEQSKTDATLFLEDFDDFKGHVERVKNQYGETK